MGGEYKPEAVIVGVQVPYEPARNTYVHFGSNAEAEAAMKDKQDTGIGKASEVRISWCHEKRWIRLKDGFAMDNTIANRHINFKPYGRRLEDGWNEDDVDPIPYYG